MYRKRNTIQRERGWEWISGNQIKLQINSILWFPSRFGVISVQFELCFCLIELCFELSSMCFELPWFYFSVISSTYQIWLRGSQFEAWEIECRNSAMLFLQSISEHLCSMALIFSSFEARIQDLCDCNSFSAWELICRS
jgi:hypothetical protein